MSYPSEYAIHNQERIRKFIDNPWRKNSCDDLNFGLTWIYTRQGNAHWRSIYNYLLNVFGSDERHILDGTSGMESPSEEDLDYLRSLLPREIPKDNFLLDKKNKEYVK